MFAYRSYGNPFFVLFLVLPPHCPFLSAEEVMHKLVHWTGLGCGRKSGWLLLNAPLLGLGHA